MLTCNFMFAVPLLGFLDSVSNYCSSRGHAIEPFSCPCLLTMATGDVNYEVRPFIGWYLINKETDAWWSNFFVNKKKQLMRHLLQQIQTSTPAGYFTHAHRQPLNITVEADRRLGLWIDGLWKVVALLDPFRPHPWECKIRGMMERSQATLEVALVLLRKGFLAFTLIWEEWLVKHNALHIWLQVIRTIKDKDGRESTSTSLVTQSCAVRFITSWDASLQLSFVNGIIMKERRRTCADRVRRGHLIK